MLIKKYLEFIDKIRINKRVLIDEDLTNEYEEMSEFVVDIEVETIEDNGYSINKEQLEIISLTSTSISWKSDIEGVKYVLTGGFTFNGITDALTFYSDFWKGYFSLPPNEKTPNELKHFEKLGWFERQARDLDGRYGCFIKQSGSFPPPIAFYNNGWYTKMTINLEEYLTNMFNMYAVRGWQFFYIEVTKDINEWEEAIHDMEVAVDMLPKVFPDEDWSYQIEKLKKTKKNLDL